MCKMNTLIFMIQSIVEMRMPSRTRGVWLMAPLLKVTTLRSFKCKQKIVNKNRKKNKAMYTMKLNLSSLKC